MLSLSVEGFNSAGLFAWLPSAFPTQSPFARGWPQQKIRCFLLLLLPGREQQSASPSAFYESEGGVMGILGRGNGVAWEGRGGKAGVGSIGLDATRERDSRTDGRELSDLFHPSLVFFSLRSGIVSNHCFKFRLRSFACFSGSVSHRSFWSKDA